MTPKEKAEDLVSKYLWPQRAFEELAKTKVAKECALIAVDEVVENIFSNHEATEVAKKYWKEVKQQISNL